jgi:F0F1-type ATP synthase membrane subunit a
MTLMASSADAKNEGLVFHPMDQFIVEPLFGAGPVYWYTVTNVTLWMGLSVVALILIMVVGTSKRALVPSRAQSIGELAYGFVHKMVEDVAGKDAVPYFPYIMTLFMFIVLSNFFRFATNVVYHDISYRCYSGDGDGSVFLRNYYRICEKWCWFFIPFLDFLCPISFAACSSAY